MKNTVLTYCKYVLFGAALLPIVLIALVMVPVLSWPWRIGVFMPFIVLLLWGLLEFIKKTFVDKQEQSPVPAREAPRAEPRQQEERDRLLDLEQIWKAAVGKLKGSHLKQEGDPLHVLPWYLVLGESGSGKSSAIRSARLFSPFVEEPEAEETRNCAWHFYDQGILMDTAGRYAVPVDLNRDREEWCSFLSQLRKYRKTEPINALILTVAADKLARGDVQELEDQGRQLRCRIDELMSFLGINFPVYLLITKSDLIPGMTEFCARLPGESLDQPMGLLNQELDSDVPRFLERFTGMIGERLGNLRLLLLHGAEPGEAGARLLLFPDQLRALRPGLELFMTGAFAANHYQETPLLRGVYLCSSSQPVPRPGRPSALDGRGTLHGFFLHDFFEKVLPCDRALWAPSARAVRWQRLSHKLALVCWLVIAASLCGLLSCSFIKNMRVIREASALVLSTPELRGDPASDLASMERLRRTVSDLEQKNRNWWVPRFGLNRSREVEQALKARYCRVFRDRFLAFFDRGMAASLAEFSRSTPAPLFGSYVLHLSRRCNLLKGRLAWEDQALLAARPVPDYLALPHRQEAGIGAGFGNLYLSYISWRADDSGMNQELQWLQLLLKQAFLVKGTDFGWLLGYVDREQPRAGIAMREFWSGSRPLAAEPFIAPAFTRSGKERVSVLFDEICNAYPEPVVLERERGGVQNRYRDACFEAWQSFAAQLSMGEQRLLAPKEWRAAAATMAGEQGPYFGFMRRALAELEPFSRTDFLPPWLAQLNRFQALRSAGPAGVASASGQAKRMADNLGRLVGKQGNAPGNEPGANLAKEYLNAVAQIAPVAKSRVLAHRMALQAFGDSGEVGKSPLFQAADAAQKLSQLLGRGQTDDTFSRLIFGPITFYGTYVRMETACALQAQWEEKVLKEVQGASDPQTLQYLLGKDGPVWKYVGDYAGPFIGWSPGRGYYAKSALGGSIPFRREFYSFLAKGAKAKVAAATPPKTAYQVTIKGLPTDANGEARIKPQGTRLELHCATGPQVISNMNYPISKPFVWTPDACSDVVFQIDIGETVLIKRYPGPQGFADFLRDFPGGRHTFYPGNFPREKQALERMGISFIRVNYQMFGAGDIATSKPESLPGRVPARIAECWD